MNTKIGIKDLSMWLKTLVVYGWISFCLSLIYFIIGFIDGLMYGL